MPREGEAAAFAALFDRRLGEFKAILAQLDAAAIAALSEAARLLVAALDGGHAVYVCGNGGSAADAQHIAGELAGRFLVDRRALRCAALSVDTSVLTAIGNDYGYEHVFARQVEALVQPGDVLWCLSTSGNSPNVLAAAERARQLGARVIGFVGGRGGKLPPLCDACFCAPAKTSFEIQQVHQLAYHALCEYVENTFCSNPS